MGSVHGADLPFVFGAPLVGGFGHFPRNYTNNEVALSEGILQYFANFVRTGWVKFSVVYICRRFNGEALKMKFCTKWCTRS